MWGENSVALRWKNLGRQGFVTWRKFILDGMKTLDVRMRKGHEEDESKLVYGNLSCKHWSVEG